MTEKSEVLKEKMRHVGFFDFKELYNFCFEWLKEEGYNVIEDSYLEKITDRGKEIKIKWTAKKKISDYFRNKIELNWHILGLVDAEVERNGKKEKLNKGDLTVTFDAVIEKDYENKWEDNPSFKFLRSIYDKYIIKTTLDEYEDRLQGKTEEFIAEVKSFLVLEVKK